MTPKNQIAGAVASVLALLALPGLAGARAAAESPTLEQIRTDAGGELRVSMNPATATPRLLRLRAGSLHLDGGTTKARANDFLRRYGEAFGIEDPARELEETASREDTLGMTHVSFRQVYEGVPVFASDLRLHFDEHEELVTVNGTFVPAISIDSSPTLGAAEASRIARALVAKERGLARSELDGGRPRLYVFRSGLVRGVPGANHLVWEVEVTSGQRIREFLYIDAHSGNLIDRIQGIQELERRVHHHTTATTLWREGDALPFADLGEPGDTEVNNLIEVARQTHELYANLTGGTYLSYNGLDIRMRSVYDANSLDQCPNAQWNGFTTNFCTGIAVDDVIAHEWTHAYSGFTHGLIYQWQAGALNESYSDIFGEIVDRLNGAGLGEPGAERMDGGCSTFGGQFNPNLTISSPDQVAGDYAVRDAVFNPLPPWSLSA
ncbi:MAG: hypothetical protein ACC742_01005, partial [Thermoanaerobaculales bacterium]